MLPGSPSSPVKFEEPAKLVTGRLPDELLEQGTGEQPPRGVPGAAPTEGTGECDAATSLRLGDEPLDEP